MTTREHLHAAREGLRAFYEHLQAAAAAEGVPMPPFDLQKAEGPIRLTEAVLEGRESGLSPDEILDALKRALRGEGGP